MSVKTPGCSKEVSERWLQEVLKDHLAESHPGGQHDVTTFTITPGAAPGDSLQSELVLLDVWVKVKEDGSPASQGASPVLQDGSPASPDSSPASPDSSPASPDSSPASPDSSPASPDSSPASPDSTVVHLAAKFYSSDIMTRELNKRMNSGQKEHLIYTKIIKELNQFQADRAPDEPGISIPHLIYGRCAGNENVLLMENIKIQGYNTVDKRKGLDFEHLKVCIEHIARLHALSHAFYREKDFRNKYPCFQSTSEHLKFLKPVLDAMLDIAIAFLRTLNDKKDVTQRLEACKQSLLDKYSAILLDGESITCLNHGDCWINNIMYRYKSPLARTSHVDSQANNEDSQTSQHDSPASHKDSQTLASHEQSWATHKDSQDGHNISKAPASQRVSHAHESHQEIDALKIIDWGNSTWGNPVFDLQFLLYTSTTRTVRNAHLDHLLHLYHSTFTKLTAKLGSPAANWSYEQFKLDWDRTYTVGFLFGSTMSLGTLNTSINVNKAPQPSCLDKPFLLPVKVVVDGIKLGMVKLFLPLFEKPIGEFLTKNMFLYIYKIILKELRSGQNEIMNTRFIDLICEADEKGIFSTESVITE
ncbi:hypothetical protein OTU49_013642 [Cherax quadricarinatus]|uniref:CHK kinase-like domain-containing protein n=1 Tax=Cherax quadricarinatus TaxID=27406 RepID=A0AAW0VU25_CHEQU